MTQSTLEKVVEGALSKALGLGDDSPVVGDNGSSVKIVVLQRGWVFVGRYSKSGCEGRLDNAQVIRIWGTTRGLGELAANGPTSLTKLDPAGTVTFHELTTVVMMDVDDAKWVSALS